MKCDEKEVAAIKPFEPESPYVIVCEGFHDMSLVCRLLKRMGITNCDVTYPKKTDGGNGKDAIAQYVSLLAGRAADLQGLLVVTDADDDAAKAFKEITPAFVKPFPPPPKPFEVHKDRHMRSAVFLTPGKGKTGALEDLLLDIAVATDANGLTCVDALKTCAAPTMTGWSANKQAKMRLACYIATHCEKEPCCSPAFVWSSKYKVFDIKSPILTELADFLVSFSAP